MFTPQKEGGTSWQSKQEIKRLLNTLDNWRNKMVSLMVQFGLYTGLRRGELFSLQWDDVDLDNGWICLLDTKGGKDNKLPISEKAMDILVQAMSLRQSPECPFVFPNRYGKKRTTFGNTWTRIKKCAKIPHGFRFHGLRHTYASYLASSGKVSLYTLQTLLTHKTPQMTQRYAHLFDETLKSQTDQTKKHAKQNSADKGKSKPSDNDVQEDSVTLDKLYEKGVLFTKGIDKDKSSLDGLPYEQAAELFKRYGEKAFLKCVISEQIENDLVPKYKEKLAQLTEELKN